jgi:hypothetical protein
MEAVLFSRALVTAYQSTHCHSPEDLDPHQHQCENLKYCTSKLILNKLIVRMCIGLICLRMRFGGWQFSSIKVGYFIEFCRVSVLHLAFCTQERNKKWTKSRNLVILSIIYHCLNTFGCS